MVLNVGSKLSSGHFISMCFIMNAVYMESMDTTFIMIPCCQRGMMCIYHCAQHGQGEEQTVQLAHRIFLMAPLFFFPLKDCGRVLWNYNSTLIENISELKKIKLGSHVTYMPVFCVVVFSFPLYVRDMRKALERGFALGIDTKLPWVRATATRLQVHWQLTWSPKHVLLTTS